MLALLIIKLSIDANSQVLFNDDFSSGSTAGWSSYQGTWTVSNGTLSVDSGLGYKMVAPSKSFTDFVFETDVRILNKGEAGLIFRVSNPANGVDAFRGYYVGINTNSKSAIIGRMNNAWSQIARKNIPIGQNTWYHLKVVASGSAIQFYVNDYQVDTPEQFPKFDLLDTTSANGTIGFRTFKAKAQFDNVTLSAYTPPTGPTYTNQLLPNVADPHVLRYNGTYYLYCTGSSNGIPVYSSTDLVHWTAHQTLALHNDNSWGAKWFWAPDVIERNGTFYMIYAVEEHLAIATASDPLGPFIQTVQAPMHADIKEIDGHYFTDDDGKNYLYFVRFTGGNEIWGAELNSDLTTIKETTLTRMIGVSQTWERDSGLVNEGPFVLKHKGTYYLTYSANHYASPSYGVGYATASSPLGPWTKYACNPILQSNAIVHGAGHHCITMSPDSTEMFLVYHTHNSLTQVNPRRLGIDRLQFIPQASGPDVLEAWGPTITPQKQPLTAPSAIQTPRISPVKQANANLRSKMLFQHGSNPAINPEGQIYFDLRGKLIHSIRHGSTQVIVRQPAPTVNNP
jgi:GH43 family beta-xylosidase